MKIITFSTQKGGTGKTTCSLALTFKLEKLKKKVLAVDLDAQGNLTNTLAVPVQNGGSFEVLNREKNIKDVIVRKNEYVSVLPFSEKLSVADKFLDMVGKEYRLKEALEQVNDEYEYCIIDTPPALGIVVMNAYSASDYIVIPIKSDDYYSLNSVPAIASSIESVKRYTNPNLKLLGFVLNEFNSRSSFAKQLCDTVADTAKSLNTIVFSSKITKGVAIAENKALKENIFNKKSSNKAIVSLDEFTDELVEAIK